MLFFPQTRQARFMFFDVYIFFLFLRFAFVNQKLKLKIGRSTVRSKIWIIQFFIWHMRVCRVPACHICQRICICCVVATAARVQYSWHIWISMGQCLFVALRSVINSDTTQNIHSTRWLWFNACKYFSPSIQSALIFFSFLLLHPTHCTPMFKSKKRSRSNFDCWRFFVTWWNSLVAQIFAALITDIDGCAHNITQKHKFLFTIYRNRTQQPSTRAEQTHAVETTRIVYSFT